MDEAVDQRPIPTGEGLTFEKVWAMYQETDRKMQETDRLIEKIARQIEKTDRQMEKTDRQMKQTDLQMKQTDLKMQETARQMEKTDLQMKQTDLQMKQTDKKLEKLGEQMGGLHHSFGELAEHLVAPGIVDRFNAMGFAFDDISPNGRRILDEKGKVKTEIDILLENGDFIVAVEVKSKPALKDIEHHITRLQILREHRNKHRDERKVRGAIAGAVFLPGVKEEVLDAGLYVIEQSGDTMHIDLPEGFVPKEW